jgi:hypothetical protein
MSGESGDTAGRLLGLKGRIYGCKKFTTKAKKAHEGADRTAYSFLRVPLCAFVVKILVPGCFSYPAI